MLQATSSTALISSSFCRTHLVYATTLWAWWGVRHPWHRTASTCLQGEHCAHCGSRARCLICLLLPAMSDRPSNVTSTCTCLLLKCSHAAVASSCCFCKQLAAVSIGSLGCHLLLLICRHEPWRWFFYSCNGFHEEAAEVSGFTALLPVTSSVNA